MLIRRRKRSSTADLVENRGVATVLVSGGIDSTACVHFVQKQGYRLEGLHIDYGQQACRHEQASVQSISTVLKFNAVFGMVDVRRRFSAGEIRGRNGMLITSALLRSTPDVFAIALGIHGGTPYYDCSRPFFARMRAIIEEYTGGRTTLLAPFLSWSKGDVYSFAKAEGLPMHLTYSCEVGLQPPCGSCTSCRDRAVLDAC